MVSELPDAIEIGYSRWRWLPLIGVTALMTLISASMAFEWFPYSAIGGYHPMIGAAGLAVFGLATARLVWGLFAAGEPVVFVSRYGIRDLRVADEFILWDSVVNVSACQCRRQKFVVLTITPALEKRLFAGVLTANRAFGLDGIAIGASGLAVDFDGLLEICMTRHNAARRGGRSEPADQGAGEPHLTARFA
jgi:hypothetical protein